ncbi:MAG: DinB family protein [Candidatus Dormibacter sp.]
MQLTGSFSVLGERLDAVTDREWTARAIPGSNLVGFILWHAARTIDWGLHCTIRGMPEIADQPAWRRLLSSEAMFDAGLSAAAADQVAQSVSRDDVRAYLDAVRRPALEWLSAVSDRELDQIPDFEARQRDHGYRGPAVWEEISDLAGRPAWWILARPCIAHVRVHAGEVDALRQVIRSSQTTAR